VGCLLSDVFIDYKIQTHHFEIVIIPFKLQRIFPIMYTLVCWDFDPSHILKKHEFYNVLLQKDAFHQPVNKFCYKFHLIVKIKVELDKMLSRTLQQVVAGDCLSAPGVMYVSAVMVQKYCHVQHQKIKMLRSGKCDCNRFTDFTPL
jgi:hypothetical protein